MRRSVVTYTLSRCVRCMKCVRACPTSALTMENNRILINDEKCLNCARCISTCHNQGLLAQGSTLADLESYDYTVCMVPPALSSYCNTKEQLYDLYNAIRKLGFDEVYDLSPVYGQIMDETVRVADEFSDCSVIASFCPLINRLIEAKYPMLLDNLAPLNYPHEAAAKAIRERLKDKGNVGIFNCCECEAKLAIAKYPYGNMKCETDHALAIVDIFPEIKKNQGFGHMKIDLCREGLQASNPAMIRQKDEYLIADGFDKITNILDMAEFDMLSDFHLLYLFPCFNGCSGGHLLFGNSYLSRNNIFPLTDGSQTMPTKLDFEMIYSDKMAITSEEKLTFQEKMELFRKVNAQLEKLPGYDCSACGMQTCRIMAEEIVKGNKKISDCHIIAAAKEKAYEN